MMEHLEKEVRREVRRAYYGDGLFDIVFGLGIVWACLLVLSDTLASMTYLPVLMVTLALPAAKKRWVQPRVGYVKPGRPTRPAQGLLAALTALLLAGVVTSILLGRAEQAPWLQAASRAIGWAMDHFGLLIGLIAGGAMVWNGYHLGLKRLVVYGGGLLLAGALSAWRGLGTALPLQLDTPGRFGALFFAALGLVMAGVGAVLFARFLRTHPVQHGEV